MNKFTRFTTITSIATLICVPALAHHSAAVFYQMDKEVTMSGTVTEFRMGNPHARIYFDVARDDGTTAQWMAEGGSRTVMLRRGWTGDEIKVGEAITIHGHPSRDGSNIVHMVNVDMQNGTSKFAEDTDPTEINRMLEERRRRE